MAVIYSGWLARYDDYSNFIRYAGYIGRLTILAGWLAIPSASLPNLATLLATLCGWLC
jgi:hypothetical protein